MISTYIKWIMLCSLVATAGSCAQVLGIEDTERSGAADAGNPPDAGNTPDADNTQPAGFDISSVTPSNGAVGAEPDAPITVEFTDELDALSVTNDTISLASASGDPIDIDITPTGSTLSILPTELLILRGTYRLTVDSAVRSLSGSALDEPFIATFEVRDGAWTEPQPLEQDAGFVSATDSALNAAGMAVMVWSKSDGTATTLYADHAARDGAWNNRDVLSTSGHSPTVAIDPDGNAMAIWIDAEDQREKVWSKRFVVGEGWKGQVPVTFFSVDGASRPQVALSKTGDGVATWLQPDGVWAARYVADGGWIEPNKLASDTNVTPKVAIDDTGVATVVWNSSQAVFAARQARGASWSDPEIISPPDSDPVEGEIGIDKQTGITYVVWNGAVPTSNPLLWSNRHIPQQGWVGPEAIDAAAGSNFVSGFHAVGPNGLGIVVRKTGSDQSDLFVYRQQTDREWIDDGAIGFSERRNRYNISLGLDRDGGAFACWTRAPESGPEPPTVWVRRYVVGSGWTPLEPMHVEGGGSAGNSRVTVNAAGRALVSFSQGDSASNLYTRWFR